MTVSSLPRLLSAALLIGASTSASAVVEGEWTTHSDTGSTLYCDKAFNVCMDVGAISEWLGEPEATTREAGDMRIHEISSRDPNNPLKVRLIRMDAPTGAQEDDPASLDGVAERVAAEDPRETSVEHEEHLRMSYLADEDAVLWVDVTYPDAMAETYEPYVPEMLDAFRGRLAHKTCYDAPSIEALKKHYDQLEDGGCVLVPGILSHALDDRAFLISTHPSLFRRPQIAVNISRLPDDWQHMLKWRCPAALKPYACQYQAVMTLERTGAAPGTFHLNRLVYPVAPDNDTAAADSP